MRCLTITTLIASMSPVILMAQMPVPAPEVAKLAYFEGTWKIEGEDQKNPFGPGGKTSSTEKCEWFEGRFALVCRADLVLPAGKGKSMSTFTYNAEKKRYGFDGIDSFGADISATGEITNGSWQWTSIPARMPEGMVSVRYTVTPVSDHEYTFTWEYARNKMAWQPGGKGRARKS
jgi:hypothetical protein